MLIPSPRHTRADLDYWDVLHESDMIVGSRLLESGRVERALDEIHKFYRDGPCYVATSWGKDSTVIAYLAHLSGLGLPLVNFALHGIGYDEHCRDVRDSFLRSHPGAEYHEIVESGEAHVDDRKCAPGLLRGIERARLMIGTDRYIGGVRAGESHVRRIRMRSHGVSTDRTCAPIGWWSAADIWGMLAICDLPVHPAYAMTGGGRYPRDHIRVSTIGGQKGRQFSRDTWEREYYPDIIRRLRM